MEYYYERFGYCDRQIVAPPSPELGIVVVIPCFNEPDLVGSLEALRRCVRPACDVEVLVVVNGSEDSPAFVATQNEVTRVEGCAWARAHSQPGWKVHLIYCPNLPRKHAGVGLARKIGMDEALWRLSAVGRSKEGVIASFDADCRCDPNYLVALTTHFDEHPATPGCSVYFEHPLEGELPETIYDAILAYELHLRYYVQGLALAGAPFAFHTVGSAMAVRPSAYQKQGGMNKRQAGEDFYFLQKIISLGGFTNLTRTRVIPSPRQSDRVPFGTGRAVDNYLCGREAPDYPAEAFLDLQRLFARINELFHALSSWEQTISGQLSPALQRFLVDQEFGEALAEMRANATSEATFRKRFFGWFDAFRTMKFVHQARDGEYGRRRVQEESARLLRWKKGSGLHEPIGSTGELLRQYRALDRQMPECPTPFGAL